MRRGCFTFLRPGVICPRGRQRLRSGWQHGGQAFNGCRLIVQGGVSIALREFVRGMPGEFLMRLLGNTRLIQQGNVGVPESVKINHATVVVAVGDAGGFQVETKHFCGVLGPGTRPYGQMGRLAGQVAPQGLGDVGR